MSAIYRETSVAWPPSAGFEACPGQTTLYRRDALANNGRKTSRNPIAAGVSGRLFNRKMPMLRTRGGDTSFLTTTPGGARRGSADAGTIAIPTSAATKSNMVPNCSTIVIWLNAMPLAAATPSINRRRPELVGSETNVSARSFCRLPMRLVRIEARQPVTRAGGRAICSSRCSSRILIEGSAHIHTNCPAVCASV